MPVDNRCFRYSLVKAMSQRGSVIKRSHCATQIDLRKQPICVGVVPSIKELCVAAVTPDLRVHELHLRQPRRTCAWVRTGRLIETTQPFITPLQQEMHRAVRSTWVKSAL